MGTEKKDKSFDAVKMMREMRDKISQETQGMNFEEFKAYIQKQLAVSKSKIIGQAQ